MPSGGAGNGRGVSMPARAFLLFGLEARGGKPMGLDAVSMPARAFLLFGLDEPPASVVVGEQVSMPARAFLLFGLVGPHDSRRVGADGFNAREGIFAFRTVISGRGPVWLFAFQCPRGHFCFSDLDADPSAYGEGATEFQCPRGHFCFSDKSV